MASNRDVAIGEELAIDRLQLLLQPGGAIRFGRGLGELRHALCSRLVSTTISGRFGANPTKSPARVMVAVASLDAGWLDWMPCALQPLPTRYGRCEQLGLHPEADIPVGMR